MEYINPCPTLRKLPRNLFEIAKSPELTAIVNSDQFINELSDAMSALAFPHFGFRGWKEDYTGYSPVWNLANALPLWAKKIEEITDWGLTALLRQPKDQEILWFSYEYVQEVMADAVDQVIFEQGWKPVLKAMKEMPCEEDFETRWSNVRKDWYRKWNHSRAKIEVISLQDCLIDPESGIHKLGDSNSINFTHRIEWEDYIERFKLLLKPKDVEILELRLKDYTYAQIAAKLGYKNHSGVVKRVQYIGKVYKEYDKANNQE